MIGHCSEMQQRMKKRYLTRETVDHHDVEGQTLSAVHRDGACCQTRETVELKMVLQTLERQIRYSLPNYAEMPFQDR